MRKRGARRQPRLRAYLLLPEQVARYVTPLHMSLELLPLGLFNRAHADHMAMVLNLIAVDCREGDAIRPVMQEAGQILLRMYARVKEGKAWNCTADERKYLAHAIVQIDRHLRTWTSARLLVAAALVDDHNEMARAAGGQFLDQTVYEEAA